jgi:hypothetical protein
METFQIPQRNLDINIIVDSLTNIKRNSLNDEPTLGHVPSIIKIPNYAIFRHSCQKYRLKTLSILHRNECPQNQQLLYLLWPGH